MLSASAGAAGSIRIPADCGTPSEFEREVDARLPPHAPRPTPDVSIEASEREYRLHLQIEQESREFRHADCRELFRVAVVVTVAMSLSRADAHPTEAPTSEPRPLPSTKPEPPRTEAPKNQARSPGTSSRAPSNNDPSNNGSSSGDASNNGASSGAASGARTPWALGASAASGLSFGMAPRPVLQLELEGRAMRGALGVALGLRYRAPGADQDQNERGVRVSSVGAELAFIARPHSLLEASLGVSAYRLSGVGLGSVSQRDDAAWSAGPALGLMFIPVRRRGTWVGVGGELHLDLIQPEFQILNYTTVFRVPLFSGSAFLRVGHLFN